MSAGGAGPVEQPPGPATLWDALGDARRRGLIGGDDLDAHVRQAEALAEVVEGYGRVGGAAEDTARGGSGPASTLDLGSGGGLPGLVLADRWADRRLTLLDGSTERSAFLVEVVRRLGWDQRVAVAAGRAEVLGHETELRHRFDAVVVRSFGPPAVVAECAAPFLADGGLLVVSEPPGADGRRWSVPEGLAELGLADGGLHRRNGYGFQILQAVDRCPDRYPRRTGIPAKRPLF